jgi:hypothetical protein
MRLSDFHSITLHQIHPDNRLLLTPQLLQECLFEHAQEKSRRK